MVTFKQLRENISMNESVISSMKSWSTPMTISKYKSYLSIGHPQNAKNPKKKVKDIILWYAPNRKRTYVLYKELERPDEIHNETYNLDKAAAYGRIDKKEKVISFQPGWPEPEKFTLFTIAEELKKDYPDFKIITAADGPSSWRMYQA